MTDPDSDLLHFYATPGPFTGLATHADLLEGLPSGLPELVQVVQGLLLHVFWAERYGRSLSQDEQMPLNIRDAQGKLALLRQHTPAGQPLPLACPRPIEHRQVGNCRDFSLLLCALLRFQGRPARARAGFAAYFLPDHFEDHWVVEYWNDSQQRWVMVDAQLDEFQCQALGIDFDPLDMPPGKFITGGQAWQMARSGQEDPEKFGIFDMHGLDFIAGDLVRDFLSLNKIEILPWDHGWGLLASEEEAGPFEQRFSALDELAGLTRQPAASFPLLRARFQTDPSIHPPFIQPG